MMCSDPIRLPRATAPRMMGIGCYGQPRHIAQTLTRALARFGLMASDRLNVAWSADGSLEGRKCTELIGWRNVPVGEAVDDLACQGKLAGFFLSATEGQPHLHVHLRWR